MYDWPVTSSPDDDFDYSSPEGERVIRVANSLVLDVARPLARKVELYERTFGLAVIPVLLRRAVLARWRQRRSQTRGGG